MEPPLSDGNKGKLYVKVHRQGRPPNPWLWAIYQEGHLYPRKVAGYSYRSAEEAWEVGCIMLLRFGRSVG
jgi:hypothetical protein